MQDKLKTAANKKDSAIIEAQLQKDDVDINQYREDLIKKNKELYHFSLTLEEYRKKIAFICIDFIMKKGK